MTTFFDHYSGGSAATIADAAARMRDMGLTPDDVLRLYDEWMDARMADMIPAELPHPPTAVVPFRDGGGPQGRGELRGDIRRRPGQADTEHRLGACPKCGAEVWGIKKCPHISPPWRTFFACDNDDCSCHGRSRLTVEALRRKWPEGAEVD